MYKACLELADAREDKREGQLLRKPAWDTRCSLAKLSNRRQEARRKCDQAVTGEAVSARLINGVDQVGLFFWHLRVHFRSLRPSPSSDVQVKTTPQRSQS